MSQRILSVLSEESMLANTSHECNTVSPIVVIVVVIVIVTTHQHSRINRTIRPPSRK
jgi:hypothetical protein